MYLSKISFKIESDLSLEREKASASTSSDLCDICVFCGTVDINVSDVCKMVLMVMCSHTDHAVKTEILDPFLFWTQWSSTK